MFQSFRNLALLSMAFCLLSCGKIGELYLEDKVTPEAAPSSIQDQGKVTKDQDQANQKKSSK